MYDRWQKCTRVVALHYSAIFVCGIAIVAVYKVQEPPLASVEARTFVRHNQDHAGSTAANKNTDWAKPEIGENVLLEIYNRW